MPVLRQAFLQACGGRNGIGQSSGLARNQTERVKKMTANVFKTGCMLKRIQKINIL